MLSTIKARMNKTCAMLAGALLSVTAGAVSAQTTIDVSSITTILTSVGVAVATVGAAVLVVVYGAKAYKWIRSAG